MDLKSRKIIAREFLLILLALTIALIGFFILYPYNFYKVYQIKNLDEKYEVNNHFFDSLMSTGRRKKQKQIEFHKDLLSFIYYDNHHKSDPFESFRYDNINQAVYKPDGNLTLFDTTLNFFDNSALEFNLKKSFDQFRDHFGYSTIDKFKKFILENSINENDIIDSQKAVIIDHEINEINNRRYKFKSQIFSFDKQLQFSLMILLFIGIVFFPVRYLYYCLLWSIRILKEK